MNASLFAIIYLLIHEICLEVVYVTIYNMKLSHFLNGICS